MLQKFLLNVSLGLLKAGLKLSILEKKLFSAEEETSNTQVEVKPVAETIPAPPPPVQELPNLEELPDRVIFKAMFERKFGKFGLCPIQLAGRQHLFTSDQLYEMLKQIQDRVNTGDIKTVEDQFLLNLHDALIAVIMQAHGEPAPDATALN